ncbi:hypothetical protein [Candidatus Liberibacter sp.]|uniref:hypothetical protein n=1 Tax=Candidatus Liberibacter sp. TaxID=34022 RepID=UPI0015F50886|nr:hypothetical protein [Candidatus Liberibacter sp.]MBA5724427.1 hypothetical protein [Candidatus Liberibacter sp.]
MLSSGENVSNYELKEGRKGNRAYRDEKETGQMLTRILGKKATKKFLLSPAEIDRLAKAQRISEEDLEAFKILSFAPMEKQSLNAVDMKKRNQK